MYWIVTQLVHLFLALTTLSAVRYQDYAVLKRRGKYLVLLSVFLVLEPFFDTAVYFGILPPSTLLTLKVTLLVSLPTLCEPLYERFEPQMITTLDYLHEKIKEFQNEEEHTCITVNELAARGQTGDLLLQSEVIKLKDIFWFMGSKDPFTKQYAPVHSGMLIRDPPLELLEQFGSIKKGDKASGVYLLDIASKGVSIKPIDKVLHYWTYDGTIKDIRIIWRRMICPEDTKKNLDHDSLWKFLAESKEKKFDLSVDEALSAMLKRHFGVEYPVENPLERLFCSELVAESLKRLRILDEKCQASYHFPPGGFWPNDMLDQTLKNCNNNVKYETELRVLVADETRKEEK